MTESHDTRWLTQVRATRPGGEPISTPACLDHHAIASLADGSLDATRRADAVRHVAGCDRCRREVASVARALSDPAVARELEVSGRTRRRRLRWLGGLAASMAAAVAVLVLVRPGPHREPEPHRSAIGAAPAPRAVWPEGTVDQARLLNWTPVAGADRYRVTLFDADGSVRYETATTDTFVLLSDAPALLPGAVYGWTVDARVGFDRWVRSPIVKFVVRR